MESCRGYLTAISNRDLDANLQAKVGASDIVQQAMLTAQQDFHKFAGHQRQELLAWLRQILARVLGHEVRRYRGTKKRDIAKERSLEQSIASSSQLLGQMLAADGHSPSQIAQRQEEEARLAAAMERLPKEYREVIIRRNIQVQSHEQIAEALDKSVSAVRMIWVRALKRLKSEMRD